MRYLPLILALVAGAAHATPVLEVTVVQGSNEPVKFRYDLDDKRNQIDLRTSHRYDAAVHDASRKKDICREAEYQTGLMLTLRYVESEAGDQVGSIYPFEVIGQVSDLKSLTKGKTLSCGQNTEISLENKAFSDTAKVSASRPKVMVINNNWTVFLTVRK